MLRDTTTSIFSSRKMVRLKFISRFSKGTTRPGFQSITKNRSKFLSWRGSSCCTTICRRRYCTRVCNEFFVDIVKFCWYVSNITSNALRKLAISFPMLVPRNRPSKWIHHIKLSYLYSLDNTLSMVLSLLLVVNKSLVAANDVNSDILRWNKYGP